jgi:CNT family concentrative nucleoside transporter
MFLFSNGKKQIKWKMIIKALIAQFILCIIFIKVPTGIWVIEKISDAFTMVLGYGRNGLAFVFGPLIDIEKSGFIFLFQVLTNLIFFGALVSVLSYLGILGLIIKIIGTAVGKLVGTTRVESFITVANMFLGQTESPLLVAKYLESMTKSEIFVVVVAGMGSMSVSILGGYNALGIPMQFLILACTLIPFGSIIMSKIMYPEQEEVAITSKLEIDRKVSGCNVIDALGNGAMDGIKIVAAIAASLVAIVAVVSLINGILSPTGLTIEKIFSWIFYPISYFMGLNGEYTDFGAQLLGSKLVLNEFVAFSDLAPALQSMDYRTQAVLCISIAGFANIGSMAVCVASIGSLFPPKKEILAQIIVRALVAAFALNLFNAFLVGFILSFS